MRQSTLAKITALRIRGDALNVDAKAIEWNNLTSESKYGEEAFIRVAKGLRQIAYQIERLIAEEERMGLSNIETGDWRKTLPTPPNQGTFPPEDECVPQQTAQNVSDIPSIKKP